MDDADGDDHDVDIDDMQSFLSSTSSSLRKKVARESVSDVRS